MAQEKIVAVGPWGGANGVTVLDGDTYWTYSSKYVLSQITITHSVNVINSFNFFSTDEKGNWYNSKRGGQDGQKEEVIDIDMKGEESLKGISGTYGTYKGTMAITSLSFSTNKREKIGPFGTPGDDGTSFEISLKDGAIAGFYGYSGTWLKALGLYLKNHQGKSILVEPWGGPRGHPWTYKIEGVLSNIHITYDDDPNTTNTLAIHSINFTSKDDEGKLHFSPEIGERNGSKKIEIVLNTEENETLTGISGTHDNLVRSLCFSTNKRNVIGPFGLATGTPFLLHIKDGAIEGFHGRSGWWLDYIGVILRAT